MTFHGEQCHGAALCTTKTTLKRCKKGYIPTLKIKGEIEKKSITALRKKQGNPIFVSIICNIHDSVSLVVDCKSWTLGLDFLSLAQCGDRFYFLLTLTHSFIYILLKVNLPIQNYCLKVNDTWH